MQSRRLAQHSHHCCMPKQQSFQHSSATPLNNRSIGLTGKNSPNKPFCQLVKIAVCNYKDSIAQYGYYTATTIHTAASGALLTDATSATRADCLASNPPHHHLSHHCWRVRDNTNLAANACCTTITLVKCGEACPLPCSHHWHWGVQYTHLRANCIHSICKVKITCISKIFRKSSIQPIIRNIRFHYTEV